MGSTMFCLPMRPVLMRVRYEYQSQGVEAYVSLDDITIAAHEATSDPVGTMSFLSVDNAGRQPQPG